MRMILLSLCLLPFLVMGADPVVTLCGKVVSVTDGDTLSLLVGKETIKIRLEGIDAPESKQSFGTKSKDALKELVAGKQVAVVKSGEDKYGRTLGLVRLGDTDVNAKLVADGWAWHYKKYSKDELLAQLEVEARDAGRGLWADPKALPPWEFRQRQKVDVQPQAKATETAFAKKHWLNTSSNIRHNMSCEHFNNTKKGRFCSDNEGKPCGKCGG